MPRDQDPKALRTDTMASTGEGDGMAIICGLIGYGLEEVLEFSDVIVVGKVGETIATDYADRYTTGGPWRGHYSDRFAFHQIEIQEVIKGSPSEPLILGRIDVGFYMRHCFEEISQGDNILLFAYEEPHPQLLTNQLTGFYTTIDDSGIFDVDDQGRAYPKRPYMDYRSNQDSDNNSNTVETSVYDLYQLDQDGIYYLDIGQLSDYLAESTSQS